MRVRTGLFALALALLFVVPVMAQTIDIPRYTVVPVVMQDTISSATARVGDRFYAICSGSQCGGFPSGTRFLGTVTAVTRKSGRTPGQIDVTFTQAILPNTGQVDIDGSLTSLNSNAVRVDPQTGYMVGTAETRNERHKFIGYGAGAGLIIGALSGNTLKGGVIGAAAGWLLGATIGRETEVKEAVVPAGTSFGILLHNPVTYTWPTGGQGPGRGPGPQPGPRPGPQEISVTLYSVQPFTTNRGVLMVPFRATMNALDQDYSFNRSTERITIVTRRGTLVHTVGTNYVTLDGNRMRLSARSRMVHGSLYVPSDLLAIATGRNRVTWNRTTDTLIIR